MSRSYKKHPYIKCNGRIRLGKKLLHKRIRKIEDIPNGNCYRKYVERWSLIYDTKDIERLNEILVGWNNNEDWTEYYDSWNQVYKEWLIHWKSK